MNKKGDAVVQSVMFYLYDLLLVAALIGMGILFTSQLSEPSIFEQNVLAKDFGLTVFTLYHLPGKATYTYAYDNFDLSPYKFEIRDTTSTVINSETNNRVSYPLLLPITVSVQGKKKILITRTQGGVHVS
jgi:hypothetical protein